MGVSEAVVANDGEARQPAGAALFTAIWLAAGLGLAVQSLAVVVKLMAGGPPPVAQVALDMLGGVSWSVVVCGALSLGVTASKQAGATGMGLLGLLGAPLGFALAKGAQRGVQWLTDMPADQLNPLVFTTAGLKSAEYALLGFFLGRLLGTDRSTQRNHAALGATFGLIFATLIIGANFWFQGGKLPMVRLAGIGTNEFVFPIGCSVLIYWVARITGSTDALTRLRLG